MTLDQFIVELEKTRELHGGRVQVRFFNAQYSESSFPPGAMGGGGGGLSTRSLGIYCRIEAQEAD